MKKPKRLLKVLGRVLLGAAVLTALGFAERNGVQVPIREVQVDLEVNNHVRFISPDRLKAEVDASTGPVIGVPVNKLNEAAIEQHLRAIPCVAQADVYHTMDGVLHVHARQRNPIVRVINADGTGFYIDDQGWTMPLDAEHAARVLVITGQINEPFDRTAPIHLTDPQDSLAANHPRSADIYQLALTLAEDPLWSVMFSQAVIDAQGEYTLIPNVGMMRIRTGTAQALPDQLVKLRAFLEKGLPQADWRRYATIDLRFKDQVVCTKRQLY